MELPRGSNRGLAELLFVVLAMLQFAVAIPSVIFHYGTNVTLTLAGLGYFNLTVPNNPSQIIDELQEDDILCLGDFFQSVDKALLLSLPQPLGSRQRTDVAGRCLYRNPVQLKQSNAVKSFSTSFNIEITSELTTSKCAAGYISGTLQGLAFIISTDNSTQGDAKGYLGWLNSTTSANVSQASTGHNFAVEIDFFQDTEFQDPVRAHVGIDINNLKSRETSTHLSTYEFGSPTVLISTLPPSKLTVWIDYNGSTQILAIYVSADGDKYNLRPKMPTLSSQIDLKELLSQENVFVGFSGSISNLTFPNGIRDNNLSSGFGFNINDWTFNSDGLAPDFLTCDEFFGKYPDESGRIKSPRQTIITISVTISSVVVFLILVFIIWKQYMRNARLTALAKKYGIEEVMLDGGPQNFKYKVLSKATKGFSPHEVLGSGGFGSVYKGRLWLKGADKPTDIAVKRMSNTSHQGAREFLAEVKVIGQAQHRNLVRLLGWCHERGELLLVYDYMPNGSVDQHLFKDSEGEPVLTWTRRLKVISGVATALAYLHGEWEQRVIHRDVKASNVMLDSDFNARLGDFGLARLSQHDQALPSTVALAGTYGYLAPELAHTLKATEKTDVYSFGAMVLEVATGKRPLLSLEDQKVLNEVLLVDWVWGLFRDDALLEAADCRIQGAYDPGEMILFLKLGLLCSHPDPDARPDMRAVLNIWKGSSPFPTLPRTKPVPTFAARIDSFGLDTAVTISTDVTYAHTDRSGDQTLSLDADSQDVLTVSSKNDGEFIEGETQLVKKFGSQNSILRHRHCNPTTSLPLLS